LLYPNVNVYKQLKTVVRIFKQQLS